MLTPKCSCRTILETPARHLYTIFTLPCSSLPRDWLQLLWEGDQGGHEPNQLMFPPLPVAARDSLSYRKDISFLFFFLLLVFLLGSCVSQQLQVVSTLFTQGLRATMHWVFCVKARSAFLHMIISLCFYASYSTGAAVL